jgi:hypothetical protein
MNAHGSVIFPALREIVTSPSSRDELSEYFRTVFQRRNLFVCVEFAQTGRCEFNDPLPVAERVRTGPACRINLSRAIIVRMHRRKTIILQPERDCSASTAMSRNLHAFQEAFGSADL